MSAENQPSDDLPIYLPFGWQSDATGDFVTYPVAQSSNIVFPISIASNSVEALNSSASVDLYQNVTTGNLNLYNDSTTGHLEIANNSGYAGGIVMNANATAPVANTVRIGDTDRPVVMPRVKLTQIDPIGAAGVFVNSDMTIANGSELFVNEIKPITSTTVSLPNGATTTAPATADPGSSRIVTSQWVRDQNFTDAAGYVTYAGAGPFTTQQTFDSGIKTNSIVTISGNLTLPASTTSTPPVPDNTARVPTCNWVNTTITNFVNATTLFAKLAGTTAFTALQTFNLGIKTNTIALVSGSTLSLPNILTNSIALVSGTTLSLPAATTTPPATSDPGSSRIVTSQWVRDQNFTDAAGYVTYAGAGPFTTQQTFNSGIKTDSIAVNIASFLGLPQSTTVTPIVPDNTTKVPTTSWVNTTITNELNATTLFAKLAGTSQFTTLQSFGAGIETTDIQGNTTASTIGIGTNQTSGGALTLGSAASAVSIPSGLKIPSITSTTTAGTLSIGTDQTAGGSIAIGTAASAVSIPSGLKIPSISSVTTAGTLNIGTDQVAGGAINIGTVNTNYSTFGLAIISIVETITNSCKFASFNMLMPDITRAGIFYQGNTNLTGYNIVMNRKTQTDLLRRDMFSFSVPNSTLRITQIADLIICGQTTGATQHFNYYARLVIGKVGSVFLQIQNTTVLTDFQTPTGTGVVTSINYIGSNELIIRIAPPAYAGATGAKYTATMIMYGGDDATGGAMKLIAL